MSYRNRTLIRAIKGWWKDFKLNVKCYGIFHALLKELPCYYSLYNFYWAIRHRTINRYNIVKLGEPGYYEPHIKLLYAPFAVLKDYIENFTFRDWRRGEENHPEYKGIKAIEEKINNVYTSWEEDKTTGWGDRESENRYYYQAEIDALKEAIRLYIWWTETFPTIDDRNPYHVHFDEMYPTDYPSWGQRLIKNLENEEGHIVLSDENIPVELKELRNKYFKESMAYETSSEEEITNNLISLMKIRNKLYD